MPYQANECESRRGRHASAPRSRLRASGEICSSRAERREPSGGRRVSGEGGKAAGRSPGGPPVPWIDCSFPSLVYYTGSSRHSHGSRRSWKPDRPRSPRSALGVPGDPYVIQLATNLNPPVAWATIATLFADQNGLVSFTEPVSTTRARSFYRLSSQ